MKADPEFLRSHYSSLCDEALAAIDRSDLIEMAQKIYDAEVSRRGLARGGRARAAALPAEMEDPSEENMEAAADGPRDGEEDPTWLEDAAEVYSAVVHPGRHEDGRAADARDLLEGAGIPCHLEMVELTPEDRAPIAGTHRWRLLVPDKCSLRAISTLERAIANPDFEEGWKAHLEACANGELPAMDPKTVFCGLFDRVERVTRAYEEEMARRGLKR
jgi:hypothetical protein